MLMTRKQALEDVARNSNGKYKGRYRAVKTFVRKLVGDEFVKEYGYTIVLDNSNGKRF